jgi:prepilin-type processing-associated H-X9-DG protein
VGTILGYGWVGQRQGETETTLGGGQLYYGKRFINKLTNTGTNSPTQLELAVDSIPSQVQGGRTNFSAPNNGMGMTALSKPTHMEKNLPAGGNIQFVDGHVAWRPFRELRDCYDAIDAGVRFWF